MSKPHGYLCPKAHKCPEGTAEPQECDAGLSNLFFLSDQLILECFGGRFAKTTVLHG